jgi:hypothetical protein
MLEMRLAIVAALLGAPAVANAAIIHCVGTDIDVHWNIEEGAGSAVIRFWEDGVWSRNICNDDGMNGYQCLTKPEKYTLTVFRPNASTPGTSHADSRWTLHRGTGKFTLETWAAINLPAPSTKTEGSCVVSAEPVAAKPIF